MSDGAFPDRLTQLRARWESDPSSRIFLQLAEEYRHQGRVREALEVLERGLKEHPGYLSALVAKGRCLLELGEPDRSRTVLERVVKQDATQMVANKLLVRAYIETSDPERARERLDLYTLLNDSDPEIEELRRRLRAMDQTSQAENPRPPVVPGRPLPPPASPRTAGEDIFDLGLPAPRAAVSAAREEEPFAELWAPREPAIAAPSAPAPLASSAPAASTVAVLEEPEPAHVLFPGMDSRESRQRYLAGLASEGLFQLDLTPESPEIPEIPAIPWTAAPEAAAPAWVPEPEPAEEQAVEEEPQAAAVPEPEPIATATLGDLYLRQGYPAEAERIFRDVLRREPASAAALEGIAKLSSPAAAEVTGSPGTRPVEARDLLAGYQPAGRSGPAEGRARKAFLLSRYLERIRGGGQRDVS
ncbi:MAG TPA: tetratricopeptide repeat protein [Thermoanaerobaculia bacterium]|jgi:tetratricopeptide (TPR) repeat protein|nr:tetratricopeptide repeat protein [Thermoanaerobaculia bacterium]